MFKREFTNSGVGEMATNGGLVVPHIHVHLQPENTVQSTSQTSVSGPSSATSNQGSPKPQDVRHRSINFTPSAAMMSPRARHNPPHRPAPITPPESHSQEHGHTAESLPPPEQTEAPPMPRRRPATRTRSGLRNRRPNGRGRRPARGRSNQVVTWTRLLHE